MVQHLRTCWLVKAGARQTIHRQYQADHIHTKATEESDAWFVYGHA